MGDIWPYGPAKYVSFAATEAALRTAGFSAANANIGAAIGTAESSRDLTVINDTPSTGDYSVGVWQINYYGSLYASRARDFGTPKQLVTGGIGGQAHAARSVFDGAGGWTPWSTYNSGAYRQYLQGGGGGGSGTPPGPPEPTVQEGSTGPAVTTLQLDLDDLGAHLTADGIFGAGTKAAVVAFQGKHRLAQDGIAGPATWAAIYAAIEGTTPPLPNPGPPPGSPPPREAPGGIPGSVQAAWSTLDTRTGPDMSVVLTNMAGSGALAIRSRK